jgi:hypothetical protein
MVNSIVRRFLLCPSAEAAPDRGGALLQTI